jgi:hypothetical protein
MRLPGLNRRRFLTTSLTAVSAARLGLGPARVPDPEGRKGINPTSIHTAIQLGAHNLNDPRGTVVLWFFALEEPVPRPGGPQ